MEAGREFQLLEVMIKRIGEWSDPALFQFSRGGMLGASEWRAMHKPGIGGIIDYNSLRHMLFSNNPNFER